MCDEKWQRSGIGEVIFISWKKRPLDLDALLKEYFLACNGITEIWSINQSIADNRSRSTEADILFTRIFSDFLRVDTKALWHFSITHYKL